MKTSLLCLLFASVGVAGETPVAVPPELVRCASISRNSERLACFDRNIAVLTTGESVDASAASPESSFGVLTSSALAVDSPGAPREDLRSVTSEVSGFSRADDGSLVVHLQNGQAWKQISGSDPLLKNGDTVTINRAVLGSFQMIVPSGRSAKVKRVK